MNTGLTKPKQKFLPLREITLPSRPFVNQRAIAFSCDGELAIVADDSVYVLVPELPDLIARRKEREQKALAIAQGLRVPDDDDASSSEGEGEDKGFQSWRINARAQYSEESKHMAVSYPPLDPLINKELFEHFGLPYAAARGTFSKSFDEKSDGSLGEDDDDDDDDDDMDDDDDDDGDDDILGGNGLDSSNSRFRTDRPFGAGYGPITGTGSTMNHVVSVAWSPSGLGVNRRPILAVLTSAGVVGMYGDGPGLESSGTRPNEYMLPRRTLASWMVLWGVGERLMVPGQQSEISENIQGIAWAKLIAPGQALLATINDVREVAIISVQSLTVGVGGATDRFVWVVREMARFKAEGPHPKGDMWDPDWAPTGTSFGLTWSPWVEEDGCWTCLLSVIDRNHVGFRRISIKTPWPKGEDPDIEVGLSDSGGQCLNLSTDAFVEFEDAIWRHGDSMKCRGLIATPFHLKEFEVQISPKVHYEVDPHEPKDCRTLYSDDAVDVPSDNPITDLVIHPPNMADPPPSPLYTFIRMSATSTDNDWYGTNVPVPEDSPHPVPQWVQHIRQKLQVSIPAHMYLKLGYGGGGADDDGSGLSDNDDDAPDDDDAIDPNLMDDDSDSDPGAESATAAVTTTTDVPQGHEIHPHRFRLYGLALAPGGGITALLASHHSTHLPERGGWHTVKSTITFGHLPRRRHPTLPPPPDHQNLTTESRLLHHLYAAGPPVPSITHHLPPPPSLVALAARFDALFARAVAAQTCEMCGARMRALPPRTETEAERGGARSACEGEGHHTFGTCATSGLALQAPGTTRSCGACGRKAMGLGVLVERAEGVGELVGGREDGVCVACGGKFLG